MPGPLDPPVIVRKPVVPRKDDIEWTFLYKKGIEPAQQASIFAPNEEMAFRIAHKACEQEYVKFIGGLRPRIWAGPSILETAPEPVSR